MEDPDRVEPTDFINESETDNALPENRNYLTDLERGDAFDNDVTRLLKFSVSRGVVPNYVLLVNFGSTVPKKKTVIFLKTNFTDFKHNFFQVYIKKNEYRDEFEDMFIYHDDNSSYYYDFLTNSYNYLQKIGGDVQPESFVFLFFDYLVLYTILFKNRSKTAKMGKQERTTFLNGELSNNASKYATILVNEYLQFTNPPPEDSNNTFVDFNEFVRNITKDDIDPFISYGRFISKYNQWQDNVKRNLRLNTARLDELNSNQEVIQKYYNSYNKSSIAFDNIYYTEATLMYSPLFDDKERPHITDDDGIDIFNDMYLSRRVVYIKYINNSGREYIKIYSSTTSNEQPDHELINAIDKNMKALATIYMIIWISDNYDINLADANKEDFFAVQFDLTTAKVFIDVYINEVDMVEVATVKKLKLDYRQESKTIIKEAFPDSILIGDYEEIKIKGHFDIYGTLYHENPFLENILNSSLFNNYLYLEEKNDIYALKRRLDIHYRSVYSENVEALIAGVDISNINTASVSFSVNMEQTKEPKTVKKYNVLSKGYNNFELKNPGVPFIKIKMWKANDRESVSNFRNIMIALMNINQVFVNDIWDALVNDPKMKIDKILTPYANNNVLATLILKTYNYFLANNRIPPPVMVKGEEQEQGEIKSFMELVKKAKTGKVVKKRVVKPLTADHPNIFSASYNRKCGSQPTLYKDLSKEKLDDFKRQKVQVLEYLNNKKKVFSNPTSKWYFVCGDKIRKYPGLIVNKDPKTRDQYPVLPCCFPTDQIDNKNSTYTRYMAGESIVKKLAMGNVEPIKTQKILKYGRIGELPSNIVGFFPCNGQMVRFGIHFAPNSLIHCVLFALNYQNYQKLIENDAITQIERIANKVQDDIAKVINPQVYYQQFYSVVKNKNNQIIIDGLKDKKRFYDPLLYFRGLEEYFGINIFIFGVNIADKDTAKGYIDIPESKKFFARNPVSGRQNILILRNYGTEANNLDYPHCELIVKADIVEQNQLITNFTFTFGNDIMFQALNVLKKSFVIKDIKDYVNDQFEIDVNKYYLPDYPPLATEIIEKDQPVILEATAQYVDEYGKCRILFYGKKNYPLFVIPCQPQNLPLRSLKKEDILDYGSIVDKRLFIDEDNIDSIKYSSKIIGGGLIYTGMWTKYKCYNEAHFVPFVEIELNQEVDIYRYFNPILHNVSTNVSLTDRYLKLKRDSSIIYQLINWLYQISREENVGELEEPPLNQLIAPGGKGARKLNKLYTERSNKEVKNFDKFMEDYFLLKESNENSANYYDFSRLKRILPRYGNVKTALKYLEDNTNFVEGGKIIMKNEYMLLMITYRMLYLFHYYNNYPQVNFIGKINNYYQSLNDFKLTAETLLFLDKQHYNDWYKINYSDNYKTNIKIHTSFSYNDQYSVNPFLIKLKTNENQDRIFLVQNMFGESQVDALNGALVVAIFWINYELISNFYSGEKKPAIEAPINIGRELAKYKERYPILGKISYEHLNVERITIIIPTNQATNYEKISPKPEPVDIKTIYTEEELKLIEALNEDKYILMGYSKAVKDSYEVNSYGAVMLVD